MMYDLSNVVIIHNIAGIMMIKEKVYDIGKVFYHLF